MAKRTRSGAVRKVRRWCAHWFAMTDCFLIAPQRWVRVPSTCVKKQRHQKVSLFLAEDEGFDCRFAGGKSYGALGIAPSGKAPPEPCMEMSSNPTHVYKKNRDTERCLCFWQRMRDSNPRKRSQSPVCYRYTNPLFVRHSWSPTSNMGIIPRKVKKSSIIFLFFKKTFPQICSVPRHRKCVSKNKEGEKNS